MGVCCREHMLNLLFSCILYGNCDSNGHLYILKFYLDFSCQNPSAKNIYSNNYLLSIKIWILAVKVSDFFLVIFFCTAKVNRSLRYYLLKNRIYLKINQTFIRLERIKLCLDVGFAHTYVIYVMYLSKCFLKHVVFTSNYMSYKKASKICRRHIINSTIAHVCKNV